MARLTAAAIDARPRSDPRTEPPQGGARRQHVVAPELFGGLAGEQRGIRDEIAAGQLGLDHGPIALTSGVATGSDGTQHPAIGFCHQAEPVEQLTPERHPGDAGDVVFGGLCD